MTVTGPVDGSDLGVDAAARARLLQPHARVPRRRPDAGRAARRDRARAPRETPAAGRSSTSRAAASAASRRCCGACRRRTGLQIVMGSGWYRHPFLDRAYFDRHTTDEIAADIVRDIEVGVGGVRRPRRDHRRDRVRSRHHGRRGALVPGRRPGAPANRRHDLHARRALAHRPRAARHPLPGGRGSAARHRRPQRHGPRPGLPRSLAERGAWVEFDNIDGDSDYDNALGDRVRSGTLSAPATSTASCSPRTSACDRSSRRTAESGTPSCWSASCRCCATPACRTSRSHPARGEPAEGPDR